MKSYIFKHIGTILYGAIILQGIRHRTENSELHGAGRLLIKPDGNGKPASEARVRTCNGQRDRSDR